MKYTYGGDIEIEHPIYRCRFCGQPLHEVRNYKDKIVVSCETEGCPGNQDVDKFYTWAKYRHGILNQRLLARKLP